MKILIKKAKIYFPASPFHLQVKDISIVDGIITSIETEIIKGHDTVIEEDGICISPGWMDIFADFADPGFEHNETLESGAAAAAAGGFTDIMLIPNTDPPTSGKSQVAYLLNKSKDFPVNIYPIGSITKNTDGKELAEMYDMAQTGAIAFSDGIRPVENAGLLSKALQYVLPVNKIVIQMPAANNLSGHGLMNEGIFSTRFGLPGMPAIAEELMINRDIELAKYTGSKIHITGVSTAAGLKKIEDAKKEGVHVTCSVTPQHLWFTDADLGSYDTNLKLLPPLRTMNDKEYLIKNINENTIDCFASHHLPHQKDNKDCEFEYAKFGNTGLETMFPSLNSLGISLDLLIEKLSITPRNIFNLPIPLFEIGAAACITIFSPEQKFVYSATNARSQSINTAFLNKELKGKVIGIINKKQLVLN